MVVEVISPQEVLSVEVVMRGAHLSVVHDDLLMPLVVEVADTTAVLAAVLIQLLEAAVADLGISVG